MDIFGKDTNFIFYNGYFFRFLSFIVDESVEICVFIFYNG